MDISRNIQSQTFSFIITQKLIMDRPIRDLHCWHSPRTISLQLRLATSPHIFETAALMTVNHLWSVYTVSMLGSQARKIYSSCNTRFPKLSIPQRIDPARHVWMIGFLLKISKNRYFFSSTSTSFLQIENINKAVYVETKWTEWMKIFATLVMFVDKDISNSWIERVNLESWDLNIIFKEKQIWNFLSVFQENHIQLRILIKHQPL